MPLRQERGREMLPTTTQQLTIKKGETAATAGAAHRRHRVPERESKRILAASQKRRGKENKSERERENGNKRERKQQSTILRIEKREMEERTGERVSFPFVLILPPPILMLFRVNLSKTACLY